MAITWNAGAHWDLRACHSGELTDLGAFSCGDAGDWEGVGSSTSAALAVSQMTKDSIVPESLWEKEKI